MVSEQRCPETLGNAGQCWKPKGHEGQHSLCDWSKPPFTSGAEREAGHLLDDALGFLQSHTSHDHGCPRGRDDYDCTCGLSDLKARIKEWLSRE